MAKLPRQLVELLRGGHLMWVCSVDRDGTPNVSIKASAGLVDDDHLYFADMFSRKTRWNLETDKRVAVGVHDPERGVALQIKGTAELLTHGEIFDLVCARVASQGAELELPPVRYVVEISVDSVWDMSPGPNAGQQIA
jgi:uncharacterized protein